MLRTTDWKKKPMKNENARARAFSDLNLTRGDAFGCLHKDFTRGNILSHLIRFGAPFLLSNFVQALYNVTDMLVVGNFSTTQALAGVTNGGQITNVVVMVVAGLTVGGTILVGQFYGAKREKDVSRTIGTLFTVLGLAALAFTIGIIALAGPVLRLIQTPEDVMGEARAYLQICMLGNLFVFGYNAVSAVQRGLGDAMRPLIFVGIACVINIVLDIWFVKGLGMGAAGAAWATIIAQGVSVLMAASYLARKKFLFDFKWRSFAIDKEKLRMIFKIGLPSSAQSLVVSVSFLTLTALTNGFGISASAAGGVVGKLNSFAILPVLAIQQSISAISAQNIGGGRYDRALEALKKGILFSFILGAVVFAVVQWIPGPLIALFFHRPGGDSGGHGLLARLQLRLPAGALRVLRGRSCDRVGAYDVLADPGAALVRGAPHPGGVASFEGNGACGRGPGRADRDAGFQLHRPVVRIVGPLARESHGHPRGGSGGNRGGRGGLRAGRRGRDGVHRGNPSAVNFTEVKDFRLLKFILLKNPAGSPAGIRGIFIE